MSTKKGNVAEDRACQYLQRSGYEILDRNYRLGRGEIDIVALKSSVLVFVEVKGHAQRDSSLLATHPNKCARIVSAANGWLVNKKIMANINAGSI